MAVDAPRMMYCIVPLDLADELRDVLRDHFATHPTIRVIVSRRKQDRRRRCRRQPLAAAHAEDRRRIRNPQGRRIADRRMPVVRVNGIALPAEVWRDARRLTFVQPRESTLRQREDAEADRLVARFQAGDGSAMHELYVLYFERVCAYARMLLSDEHEAEDVAQQVFVEVFRGLERFEIRSDQPVRAWVFWLARNRIRDTLRRHQRFEVEPPATIQTRSDCEPVSESIRQSDWIEDPRLAELLESLPLRQRQVLMLRYLADASTADIGLALGSSPTAVRILQHRALRTLERGIGPRRLRPEREPMVARIRPATVARGRRFALVGRGIRRPAYGRPASALTRRQF